MGGASAFHSYLRPRRGAYGFSTSPDHRGLSSDVDHAIPIKIWVVVSIFVLGYTVIWLVALAKNNEREISSALWQSLSFTGLVFLVGAITLGVLNAAWSTIRWVWEMSR